MIVYNKANGRIVTQIPDDQDIMTYFREYSDKFRANLDVLYMDEIPRDLFNYKVIDKELVMLADSEIQEIREFGKILTDEERLLNNLRPSYDEV